MPSSSNDSAPRGLFLTDLDGTLLAPDRTIPERNLDAIRRATDLGVVVAIVTGRRQSAVEREYPKLDGLRYRVATSNGSVILRDDNHYCEAVTALDWSLIDLVRKQDDFAHAQTLCITAPPASADEDDGSLDCLVLAAGSREWVASVTPYDGTTHRPVSPEAAFKRPLVHVAMHLPSRDEANGIAEILDDATDDTVAVHVVTSPTGEGALTELIPRGGKGLAVRHFAEAYGLANEAIAGIGDEVNDRDMMEAVGHPFVVGESVLANQLPELTEVSSAIDGAVADAIDQFLEALG